MVADYNSKDLIRSLVRVPKSGRDASLESSLLDLSNVSQLAATIPVSRTLPPELSRPFGKKYQGNRTENKNVIAKPLLQELKETSAGAKKRSLAEEPMVGANMVMGQEQSAPPNKRVCVTYMTKADAAQPQALDISGDSTLKLLQQREALHQENRALHQQLALFQQLFRNKDRLKSVLKRLGVQLPP
ncbi:hypothetical protein SK128_018994 [Halocaridina rubra]|uniref:Uncharacterized protein n=1 Tax=Halocaridina rubra TaxID=373956 RepID=A0AAN8WCU1_HALRR